MIQTAARACDGKIRHDSLRLANLALAGMRSRVKARAYPRDPEEGCVYCGGWHVGRTEK